MTLRTGHVQPSREDELDHLLITGIVVEGPGHHEPACWLITAKVVPSGIGCPTISATPGDERIPERGPSCTREYTRPPGRSAGGGEGGQRLAARLYTQQWARARRGGRARRSPGGRISATLGAPRAPAGTGLLSAARLPSKPVAFTVNAEIEVKLERLIREGKAAESYVTDVVHDADQQFATLACRQERAIAGLSAGAFGAANIGLHHDDMFGLIQVWSGYFTETHNGVFARRPGRDGRQQPHRLCPHDAPDAAQVLAADLHLRRPG